MRGKQKLFILTRSKIKFSANVIAYLVVSLCIYFSRNDDYALYVKMLKRHVVTNELKSDWLFQRKYKYKISFNYVFYLICQWVTNYSYSCLCIFRCYNRNGYICVCVHVVLCIYVYERRHFNRNRIFFSIYVPIESTDYINVLDSHENTKMGKYIQQDRCAQSCVNRWEWK